MLLLLAPLIGFSGTSDLKEEHMKILSELGLPLPGSGIKLVPRAIFGDTEEELKKGLLEEKQMKENGYIEENTSRPMELIHFKDHAKFQMKQYANDSRNASTHIRESSDNIKLAFKFKGVPTSLMISQIGFVPQGAFHKEGWTGAVQFFDAKNIGTCAYAQMNVAASHTAAEIVLEDATYTINNKVTLMEVRGNKSSAGPG